MNFSFVIIGEIVYILFIGEKMQDKLKILLQISSKLSKEKDVKKILMHLTNLARELLQADRCSIFLHDEDKKELWTLIADGVKEIRIKDNQGIAGSVFKSGEVLNINDPYNDKRFNPETDRKTGYKTNNLLVVPLFNKKGKVMGVFEVINKLSGNEYSKEDIDLLTHIAVYAASALENALLYEKLKKAHEDVVYRLSNATKFKDPETENHIIRVGLFCEIIAVHLGWDEEESELVKLAAPMHDIGKVGIPDRVLLKPDKLTPAEWEIMKKHTVYGYEILKGGDSRLLQLASLVALDHHEKWDGSGYPHGKKETEISIYGRMTAIADVFDALTSDRHYKKAWSFESTKTYILDLKGRQFDPDLIDIFESEYDEIVRIKSEYKDT